mgnify:CR=1 FL=1
MRRPPAAGSASILGYVASPPAPAADPLREFLAAIGLERWASCLRAEEIHSLEDLKLLGAEDLQLCGLPRDAAASLARVLAAASAM